MSRLVLGSTRRKEIAEYQGFEPPGRVRKNIQMILPLLPGGKRGQRGTEKDFALHPGKRGRAQKIITI
jgi:hypothetical protein